MPSDTETTIALCVIADDHAIEDGFEQMVLSAKDQVQALYISYSGTDDAIAHEVLTVANRHIPRGNIGIVEWLEGTSFSFARVRNHSFQLAQEAKEPCDWLFWMDCDDRLDGDLRGAIEEMVSRRAHFAFLPYRYTWSITHAKERIFRADVEWKWEYPIHECCRGPMSTRSVSLEDPVVVHHRQRGDEKRSRNHDAILDWYKSESDNPRATMLLGHSMMDRATTDDGNETAARQAMALYAKAVEELDVGDDTYHCLLSMAMLQARFFDPSRVTSYLARALEIHPRWPQAMIAMAEHSERQGDLSGASEWARLALDQSPPETLHVWDREDADQRPAQVLTRVSERRAEQQGSRWLGKGPHKDRWGTDPERSVCFFLHPGAEPFNPELILEHGSGGTERLVTDLARYLAADGRRVVVYGNVGDADGSVMDGVEFYDSSLFHPDQPFGAFVAVRAAQMLSAPIKARRKILWLHDVNVGPLPLGAIQHADMVVVPSPWLARRTEALYGVVEGMRVVPNGIDFDLFSGAALPSYCRDLSKVLYASSPDRGLERLLDLWPSIVESTSAESLDVFYGWDAIEALIHAGHPAARQLQAFVSRITFKIDRLNKRFGQGTVNWNGRVSEPELAVAMGQAGCLASPSSFCETFGMVFVQAMAAQCPPVTSRLGAPEEFLPRCLAVGGSPDSEEFADRFVDAVKVAFRYHHDDSSGQGLLDLKRVSKTYDNQRFYESWDSLLSGHLDPIEAFS